MIWLSSDLHLGHQREFIYRPRGFQSVEEMNDQIIRRWNTLIQPEDDVYILGDVMLGNNESGMAAIAELNGRLHLIRGNHDTDTRIGLFKDCRQFVEICDAKYLKYGKYHFYLTHYPCLTGNLKKESLTQGTINICGHSHSTESIHIIENSIMYHVELDAHSCFPVSIEQVIEDMKNKVEEYKELL